MQIKWLHTLYMKYVNCPTLPSQPNSPCRYDSLPYPLFYVHSWLQGRRQHACAQRTPRSSMDHYLPSKSKRKSKRKERKSNTSERMCLFVNLKNRFGERNGTHIHNHFTALAGANLTKELHNKSFCHVT